MELNKINSSGTTWGTEASVLNENFRKIDSSIEQLKNSTIRNKGYFSNEAALKSAVPAAAKGDKAYVGSAYPYQIWTWNGSAWANSGSTGGEEYVNLGDYHTADYVDGKLSELGSEVGLLNQATEIETEIQTIAENTDVEGLLRVAAYVKAGDVLKIKYENATAGVTKFETLGIGEIGGVSEHIVPKNTLANSTSGEFDYVSSVDGTYIKFYIMGAPCDLIIERYVAISALNKKISDSEERVVKRVSEVDSKISSLEASILGTCSVAECDDKTIGTSNVKISLDKPIDMKSGEIIQIEFENFESNPTNTSYTVYLWGADGNTVTIGYTIDASTSAFTATVNADCTLSAISLRTKEGTSTLSARISFIYGKALIKDIEDKLISVENETLNINNELFGCYNKIIANNSNIGTSNTKLQFSQSMLVEEGNVLNLGVDGYETTNTGDFTCYLFGEGNELLSNSFVLNSSTHSVSVSIIKSGVLKSMSLRASTPCVLSANISIKLKAGIKEKTENIVSDSVAKGEPSLCIIGKDGGVLFSNLIEKTYKDHAYHSTVDIENSGGFVEGSFGEEGTFYGLPTNLANGVKISFDVEFAKDLQNKTGKSVNFMNIGGYHSGLNGNITARFMSPNTENIQVNNEVRVITNDGKSLVRYNNYEYPYEDGFLGEIAFSIKGDNKNATIDESGLYIYSNDNSELIFSVPFASHDTLRSWGDSLYLLASEYGVEVELFDVENKTTSDLLMQNKIDISRYPLYARTIKEGKTNIEVILRSDAEKQYIDMFVDGQIALGNREIQNASGLQYNQSYVVIGGEGVKVSNIKVCHNDISRTYPRLIVVMLHSIRPDNYTDELGIWITPSLLRAELDLFAKYGYENISIEDVIEYMRNGKAIPKRAFAIIHDDDYYFGSKSGIKEFDDVRKMYYNRNIKAGFAIIPAALNDNEKKEEVIARMKKDSNLFSFGVHGYEHEVWGDLSFEEAKEKLNLATSLFEELVGYSPRYFVYPTNNYGWRTITNLFEYSQFSVAFANNTASAHIGVGRSCCKMALSRIDGAQSMDIIESLIK